MKHTIQNELIILCKEILQMNKTLEEWDDIQSCDMFQLDPYIGGFEGLDDQFTFSVYIEGDEYWFQFKLEDVAKIISGEIKEIPIRQAEI